MTVENKEFKQQILFEELDTKSDKDNDNALVSQVIVDDSAFTEVDELVDSQVVVEDFEKNKSSWTWKIIGTLVAVLTAIELVQFFIEGFQSEPIIAALYASLLAAFVAATASFAWRELRGLGSLKKRNRLREQARSALQAKPAKAVDILCDDIYQLLPIDLPIEEQGKWSASIPDTLNDKEIVTLFSKQVLSQVDDLALEKVSKHSAESVVLVALSPLAFVDMLIVFWRNMKMINEISSLYGLRLSYWSRIRLIKQVFKNMVLTGATELIADLGTDIIGADLLGKLSARLAQGLGAGMLTARLGLQTMYMCRPIPFDNQNAPKVKQLRGKVVEQVKNLANKK